LFVQALDNGQGLAGDPAAGGRYGLRGLRERVSALGGEMTLGDAWTAPAPSHDATVDATGVAPPRAHAEELTRGCRLRVTLPLGAAPPSAATLANAPSPSFVAAAVADEVGP
jgi:glucose-6-phosphate-specific signal transduction histidine kinase